VKPRTPVRAALFTQVVRDVDIAMQQANVNTSEMARRVGMSRNAVASILARTADPMLSSVMLMLDALGYDLVVVKRQPVNHAIMEAP
jgi:DNA-binding phage protein